MPPAGQVKATVEPRLSDRVAIGALTQTYPPGLVDQVLIQTGRRERRHRLLPARMVVYYLLAMCLFADVAYLEVLRLLVEALRRPARVGVAAPARLPVKSALIQARARLGAEPLRVLFQRTARPLATPATHRGVVSRLAAGGHRRDLPGRGRHARQRRLVRPGHAAAVAKGSARSPRSGWSGWPSAAPTPSSGRSWAPTPRARPRWPQACWTPWMRGCWCSPDRRFPGAALWRKAQATGAALLWRVTTGTKTAPALPVDRVLADGSWRSRLDPDAQVGEPIVVRVLEYAIEDPGRPQATGQTYRLVTTILDPERAPAGELAALYHQRWELEGVLDELKTHQRGAQAVLRSKTPQMVQQEVWAHLLVHYAIRKLMHQAALAEDLDPDRLSFVGSLRIVRRHLVSHQPFPP
jgi:Insertion element 4 transposase N-terminal